MNSRGAKDSLVNSVGYYLMRIIHYPSSRHLSTSYRFGKKRRSSTLHSRLFLVRSNLLQSWRMHFRLSLFVRIIIIKITTRKDMVNLKPCPMHPMASHVPHPIMHQGLFPRHRHLRHPRLPNRRSNNIKRIKVVRSFSPSRLGHSFAMASLYLSQLMRPTGSMNAICTSGAHSGRWLRHEKSAS